MNAIKSGTDKEYGDVLISEKISKGHYQCFLVYNRNSDLHRELSVEMVMDEIRRFA